MQHKHTRQHVAALAFNDVVVHLDAAKDGAAPQKVEALEALAERPARRAVLTRAVHPIGGAQLVALARREVVEVLLVRHFAHVVPDGLDDFAAGHTVVLVFPPDFYNPGICFGDQPQ